MVKMANPQEGVFAGASIGYTNGEEQQTVTPHHRPGGEDDPYGGWKGLSSHRGLAKVIVDGEVFPYGELEFVKAGEGEGIRVEVSDSVCELTTVEVADGGLEAERERLEDENTEFQESHNFRPHGVEP